jgi:threonine dehydratase
MLGHNDFSFLFRNIDFIDAQVKIPFFLEKNLSPQQKLIIVDETDQETGSFKVRGALYAVNHIRIKSPRENIHINVASTGNFGIGIAYACKKFNLSCTVYTPKSISLNKQNAILKLDAAVRGGFKSYEEAKSVAINESNTFDDRSKFIDGASEDTFTGNLSLIRQIDRKYNLNHSDTVLVPFGTGSLYAPILLYSTVLQKNFNVFAIEPKLANKYQKRNSKLHYPNKFRRQTIASGANVNKIPKLTSEVLSFFDPKVYSVSEKQIKKAMIILQEEFRINAEAAGGLGFALLLNQGDKIKSNRIFCIVTGGNN